MDELRRILTTFSDSGWALIADPARDLRAGEGDREKLLTALQEADKICGGCGCRLDPLYKRAAELLEG